MAVLSEIDRPVGCGPQRVISRSPDAAPARVFAGCAREIIPSGALLQIRAWSAVTGTSLPAGEGRFVREHASREGTRQDGYLVAGMDSSAIRGADLPMRISTIERNRSARPRWTRIGSRRIHLPSRAIPRSCVPSTVRRRTDPTAHPESVKLRTTPDPATSAVDESSDERMPTDSDPRTPQIECFGCP